MVPSTLRALGTKKVNVKTKENWVRNICARLFDDNETRVFSYGLKHSVTPKRMLTEDIVSSVESVCVRQKQLPESTKDDLRY